MMYLLPNDLTRSKAALGGLAKREAEKESALPWGLRDQKDAEQFIIEYLQSCEERGEQDFVKWYLDKQTLEFVLRYRKAVVGELVS